MSALPAAASDPQDDSPILHPDHDWINPNYTPIYAARQQRLIWLRKNGNRVQELKTYYAARPWAFIDDWGMTFDPREASGGALAVLPFILFPRQVEYLQYLERRLIAQDSGLVEKSRDMGVSWLCVGYAVCKFCCVPGFVTGFGSRKQEYVDQAGDDKSLFHRAREFLSFVPPELWPRGFDPNKHSAHMRIWCPSTGAALIGEAGDNIGRGGRTSMYFVDESAFIVHQELTDRALSANTNVKIDVSSVNGNGNAFYKKRMRFDGTDKVFIFDWREDPRKDQAWYDKKCEDEDETTIAQEVDRDYSASQENQFIPAKWIKAAIDAHTRLGFRPSGIRVTGFDPADVGDAKAIVHRWGSVCMDARSMKTGTINDALPWACDEADRFRADVLRYDGDGMGTPVMRVHMASAAAGRYRVQAFNGGGAVDRPKEIYAAVGEESDRTERTNEDRFLNLRAQAWTWVHDRFRETYNAIERAKAGQLINIDPDKLVSIDSRCTELQQLVAELARPQRKWNQNGKIRVESKPEMKTRGVSSPNLADAFVMAFATYRTDTSLLKIPFTQPSVRMTDSGAGY